MGLRHIEVSKIQPNPNNPRGIDIAKQDPKLPTLKDSIKQFGVLVPIVVTQRNQHYLLIDGERRYIVARSLHMKKIPAFVTRGDLSDKEILFRMFQIHHCREQWDPIQQCHALEPTYNSIARQKAIQSLEDERAKVQAIAEKLVDKTGIDQRTALDRIKFLRWPSEVKGPLYENPNEDYWYICEIEDKIIIPALRNYPEYFEMVPVDEVRVDLYAKLKEHSVSKAIEVRKVTKVFASSMTRTRDRKTVKAILKQLHKDKHMTYGEAEERFVAEFPEVLRQKSVSPRKLLNSLNQLATVLQDFPMESFRTARRRAKATPRQVLKAAQTLTDALQDFISDVNQVPRESN